MKDDMEDLVTRARGGDREALERVLGAVRDDVYGLALRMLWHPEDAEDATQEILVRVLTSLGQFRGESRFTTWVYRIAGNHLLTTRKRRMERSALSFEEFGRELEEGRTDGDLGSWPEAERDRLLEEVKVGCSHAMLLCLDRGHRLAYVLGEILGLSGPEGARVLDIEPAAFRKRLSRARERIESFMKAHCGLVNPGTACRCARRVQPAVERGRVDPARLLFAGDSAQARRACCGKEQVERFVNAAALLRSNPTPGAPRPFTDLVRELLDDGRLDVITGA